MSTSPRSFSTPAVSVVGVLVEAEVAHHDRVVAELLAQGGDRALTDAVGVPGLATPRRPCVIGTPKSMNARTPVSAIGDGFLPQRLERVLVLSGHRGDRRRLVDAFLAEQRHDQVVGVQPRLADEGAQSPGCGAAASADAAGKLIDGSVPASAASRAAIDAHRASTRDDGVRRGRRSCAASRRRAR